jgi:hypothetical protein
LFFGKSKPKLGLALAEVALHHEGASCFLQQRQVGVAVVAGIHTDEERQVGDHASVGDAFPKEGGHLVLAMG